MMNAAQLLNECESLTHATRVRRMIELGRRPAGERETVLNELSLGPVYERRLALTSCYGSRDAGRALQAALDPSGHVHGLAGRLVSLLCSEEQFLALLPDLPAPRRRPFIRQWRRAGRSSAPIDAWLRRLQAGGRQQEGWTVLAYGSPELVAEWLPQALAEGRAPIWRRAARWHPGLVGRTLLRQAEASAELNPALTQRVNSVLDPLTGAEATLALELVQALERSTPLGNLHLQPLAASRPVELAALLLASPDPAQVSLAASLRRVQPAQVQGLLQRRPAALAGAEGRFSRLGAARRSELGSAMVAAFTSPTGVLPLSIAASLPAALRKAEARRHLALPALQARPLERLPYAGLLPWDEAHTVLEIALRHPDAEQRAVALAALSRCVRCEPGRAAELLNLITARKNEQDPVRGAMLGGLADLPPRRWAEEHLDALGQVLGDMLNAADLSGSTALAAERLLVGLLPLHPGWGAAWLARLVQARGQVNLGNLEPRLTPDTARVLIAALLPIFHAWETREREGQLLQAIRSLGRFVAESGDLLALLERRVRQSLSPWISQGALALLAKRQPKQRQPARRQPSRFAALVPQLVAQDPSWTTQPLVYMYLHHSRQDLLTPFLGQQAFKGRFSTGQTRFVLPFTSGFQRWTLSQQQAFAVTLTEVSRDLGRDLPAVFRVMHQLAALPSPTGGPRRLPLLARLTGGARAADDLPLRGLSVLAELKDPYLAVRDTAVRLLGRLDAARGLAGLLAMLDDDRARIAIYALRRPLAGLTPEAALDILLTAPRGRVTVFKEVARLIGELPGDAPYRALLDLSGQELHRDVRVALLRGLWNHLNRPESWPLLLAAAQSSGAGLSDGLVRMPVQGLTAEVQPQFVELLRALLTHADPAVRLETLRFHTAVSDPQRQLLGTLLSSIVSPVQEEGLAAARVVFSSYTGRDAGAVAEAFTHFLPERRALLNAVSALQAASTASRPKAQLLVRAVLGALAADPLTLPLQARLAVGTLEWDELGGLLRGWTEAGLFHAEALTAAVSAVAGARDRTDAPEVGALERALEGGPPEARRLALAALVLSAQVAGSWSPERLARLRHFRADLSPLVAGAAQFTLPDEELLGASSGLS